LHSEWEKAQQELFNYSETIEKQYPESMFTLLLRSSKMPEPPPTPTLPNGRKDSLFPARYIKAHYWDETPLHDDRLLRTPFFDNKLDRYFRYYVVPDTDTLISEVNYLLLASRAGKDMFKYLLGRFTDKYINPEIMGQDKVFIFLFNAYFSKGDTTWLSARQKEFIFNRAYSLMANQIGEAAAPLTLTDTAGKRTAMYSIDAPYTFLVFWDPNCGHCKEMIPHIDSLYQTRWKKQGVGLYAVNIDEKALADWKKYIRDHHLTGWIHAYQPKEDRDADAKANRANYRQLYDVFQTPTLYLLDKDKRIIGKKLSLDQFDQLMQARKSR
jgi:thiol-disulfide isomerase/thioredoxin